jgi:mannosyltransferase OCH1-like enzyme
MIPKRIFYVWIGGDEKPAKVNICLEDWRKMLPGYEIIEINETSTKYFDLEQELKNNLWFKTVYDLKMHAYVSDYARIKTLYEHGGIYLDTDITVYKDFTPLLDNKMFAGVVYEDPISLPVFENIIEPSVFGSIKKHRLLSRVLNFYNQDIWLEPTFVIGNIITSAAIKEYGNIVDKRKIVKNNEISIYPKEYFQPFNWYEKFTPRGITNNTYTVHWNHGSWWSKINLYFLSNKHRIPLPTLLKQLTFIEKHDINAHKKPDVNIYRSRESKISPSESIIPG